MIRIEADLDDTLRKIDQGINQLERGTKEYIQSFNSNPRINISARLKENITSLVYLSDEPKQYKRTGDLLKAVRVQVKGNEIYVYMDDNWLSQRPQTTRKSFHHGYGDRSHGNTSTGYAWRVEQGHYYINRKDGESMFKDWNTPPRPFTQRTYEQIIREIRSGEGDPKRILKHIIRGWKR